MPKLKQYRERGDEAQCRACEAPLCYHEKTFCSRACQRAWNTAQPKVECWCTRCGVAFVGKPWRKRCDACVRADGAR